MEKRKSLFERIEGEKTNRLEVTKQIEKEKSMRFYVGISVLASMFVLGVVALFFGTFLFQSASGGAALSCTFKDIDWVDLSNKTSPRYDMVWADDTHWEKVRNGTDPVHCLGSFADGYCPIPHEISCSGNVEGRLPLFGLFQALANSDDNDLAEKTWGVD